MARALTTGVSISPLQCKYAPTRTSRIRQCDQSQNTFTLQKTIKYAESNPEQVMSVTTRRTWCRLVGHRHQIVGAEIVHFVDPRQGGQTRAITGDAAGGFFIWDIGNGQVWLYILRYSCTVVIPGMSHQSWATVNRGSPRLQRLVKRATDGLSNRGYCSSLLLRDRLGIVELV